MPDELPDLILDDAAAWRAWLGENHADPAGVWLVLAKKGTVEPTVDATKHVNGGCRSLDSEGTEWRCYLGQAAVEQRIIGPGFLGEYAPSPGVG